MAPEFSHLEELQPAVDALLLSGLVDASDVPPDDSEAVQACIERHLLKQGRRFLEWASRVRMNLIPYAGEPENGSSNLRYIIRETNGQVAQLDGIFHTEKKGWYVAPLPLHIVEEGEQLTN